MKIWKRDKSEKTEKAETAAVRKGGRQFKIKVRLFDGHGIGVPPRKFSVFVEPKNNALEDAEEKIKRLFGGGK